MVYCKYSHWGYGATAARLTPDQEVGSSNLSALILHNIMQKPRMMKKRSVNSFCVLGSCSVVVAPVLPAAYNSPLPIGSWC